MIIYLQELVMKSYEMNSMLYTHFPEVSKPNVLVERLSLQLNELQANAAKSLYIIGNDTELKELLIVLYRVADSSYEMYKMVKKINAVNLDIQMNAIREIFMELIPSVVEKYGEEEALYIITNIHKQQSAQWG